MALTRQIVIAILAFCWVQTAESETSPPKILLISMDGFKHDYLELPGLTEANISNFRHMMTNGVRASHVVNVFPTVTYPNHYTLITGLYPESHGIVHNRFYDPSPNVKDHFWYDDRRDNFDPIWYDQGAEPIYVTNKLSGAERRSGSALWPSGVGKVKGVAPDRLIPDADAWTHIDFKQRVNYIVDWFSDKSNPINLGLLYFDEPDEVSHEHGAGSLRVKQMISYLNDVLGYLFQKLRDADLYDKVNILLTADHGFTNVTEIISLSDFGIEEHLDYETGSDFGNHATLHFYPKNLTDFLQKFENETLNQKFSVYVKDDPGNIYQKESLHYRDNTRIAPVVVTAKELGVVLAKDNNATTTMTSVGYHGFDPAFKDMHPFFLAMGPAFKSNVTIETFNNVDIYPMMCHILGLTPAPNNGSLENVTELLENADENEHVENSRQKTAFTTTWVSYLVLIGICGVTGCVYILYMCYNTIRKPKAKPKATGNRRQDFPTRL